MKIILWGAGVSAKIAIYHRGDDIEIIGLIDNDKNKQGKEFNGYPVYAPEKIKELVCDYVLICSIATQEITDQLLIDYDYNKSRILYFSHFWDKSLIEKNFMQVQKIFLSRDMDFTGLNINPSTMALTTKMEWDKANGSLLNSNLFGNGYQVDYTRYRTFELCADEILNSGVKGSAAEVGVYQGFFAKLINKKLPQKNLYLFDTFESFDQNEFENDKFMQKDAMCFRNDPKSMFSDTSVDFVLKNMPHPKKCIVKKGFFPETATDCEEETFCFVSIDVDLFDAIYNSLEFFYPRLAKGGYIFIHEYNNSLFAGCKEAVKKFQKDYGSLVKVPISDSNGTLIVTNI